MWQNFLFGFGMLRAFSNSGRSEGRQRPEGRSEDLETLGPDPIGEGVWMAMGINQESTKHEHMKYVMGMSLDLVGFFNEM